MIGPESIPGTCGYCGQSPHHRSCWLASLGEPITFAPFAGMCGRAGDATHEWVVPLSRDARPGGGDA